MNYYNQSFSEQKKLCQAHATHPKLMIPKPEDNLPIRRGVECKQEENRENESESRMADPFYKGHSSPRGKANHFRGGSQGETPMQKNNQIWLRELFFYFFSL